VRAPLDAALPRLGTLLDPEAVAPALERSLGRGAELRGPRIARVAYKPGVRAVVHYEVAVDGREEHAVAFTQAGRDLAARARRPALVEVARRVNGRSPAAFPLAYDGEADALVTWLPFDPRLPALVETPERLAARLGLPASDVAVVPESYQPGARIVLQLGGSILKAYGGERAYERGVAGLRLAASWPVATPRAGRCLPDLRVTSQCAVVGTCPTPAEAATVAGLLVRRLQGSSPAPARIVAPDYLLALAAEKAAIAARALPELALRLRRAVAVLRRTAPAVTELVSAHGDLDAGQLLDVGEGELLVLDFDDACLAAPALDLATYLADVVRGEADDLARFEAVRELLLEGYGPEPKALDWHVAAVVLARTLHSFRRGRDDWPERADGMVDAAEKVLGR
jgi:phosphotransferase family enzyme